MAQAAWLSKRAAILQHTTFNHGMPGSDDEKQLALYMRYQTTQDRAFHKCLNQLLKLRAEKRKAEIGFESQQRKREENDRKRNQETRKQEVHKWNVLLAEAKVDHQHVLTMDARRPILVASLKQNPDTLAEIAA